MVFIPGGWKLAGTAGEVFPTWHYEAMMIIRDGGAEHLIKGWRHHYAVAPKRNTVQLIDFYGVKT